MASGTPRKLKLDGTEFDFFSDTDIDMKGGSFDVEPIATSGKNYFKNTKNNQSAENFTVRANALKHEILSELNDRDTSFPISFTDAAGARFADVGRINYVNYTTADGKATLQLLPENGFVIFNT